MDAESSLFTIIKVSRDKDLRKQIGKVIYFDLVDHDKVCSFSVLKDTPFRLFKEEVAKEFCIPVQFMRFWRWTKRRNGTYRPYRYLTPYEEAAKTVNASLMILCASDVDNGCSVQVEQCSKGLDSLNLFLEVELVLDLYPTALPVKTKDDILVFFKLYDPEKAQLRYVGRLFVKSYGQPKEILGKLNQMAGFALDQEIELYEELNFEPSVMCDHLGKRTSFQLSQIENGDIICFQKSSPLECPYPDVPSFFEDVRNRQGKPDTRPVSLSATSLQENLRNVLAGLASRKRAKISTSSGEISESSQSPGPQSLPEHREALKYYLALSLEAIEQANAFDQIERITVLLIQHSTSSLERTILKDLVSRLATFKEMLSVRKSGTEYMRAQVTSLAGKKAAVGARMDQALEHGGSLEINISKILEDETEIEKQIAHLTTQKEELLIRKNSAVLELQKFNDQTTYDAEEWQDISEEVEQANRKYLQERETLAQANLSWKLFSQNLEQCEKFA